MIIIYDTDIFRILFSGVILLSILIWILIELNRTIRNRDKYHTQHILIVPDWMREFSQKNAEMAIRHTITHSIWAILFFFLFMNVSILSFIGSSVIISANSQFLIPIIVFMAVIIGITLFIPLYAFSEWVVLWYKIIETLGVQYREYKYPLEIVATRYSQRDAIVGGSGDDL